MERSGMRESDPGFRCAPSGLRTTAEALMAVVNLPTTAELMAVGRQLGMNLSEQDAEFFLGTMGGNVAAYNALVAAPDNLPPVKYPRTPGYRPEGEENKYNIW